MQRSAAARARRLDSLRTEIAAAQAEECPFAPTLATKGDLPSARGPRLNVRAPDLTICTSILTRALVTFSWQFRLAREPPVDLMRNMLAGSVPWGVLLLTRKCLDTYAI